MSFFVEAAAVTAMNLRALPGRIVPSLVIVVGIAGVVAVLVSVLAMSTGFLAATAQAGRDDRAIVLRGGSDAELSSTLSRDNTLTILDAPGVAHDAEGHAIGSAEADVVVDVPMKGTTSGANVTLRGVGPQAFALRPEISIVEGRSFTPGLRELIVGRNARNQFDGLALGQHLAFRDADWQVVGIFASGGDAHESEIMADVDSVLSAYRRNLYQSVTVKLDSAAAFDAFKDALTTNPQLSVEVLREPAYFARVSRQLATLLSFLAYFVGGIMALGAVFGAVNTMYTAVSARAIEIATLRAIGFGAGAVVVSVLVEALILSLIGALIGAAIAWAVFDGNAVNSLGGNFTQIVFHLTVTPALIVTGIVWAAVIGLIGGLLPAVRAARVPVATALRAS